MVVCFIKRYKNSKCIEKVRCEDMCIIQNIANKQNYFEL